jgi:FtsP/CotA-like multicopper oxidase with cupredoxin domain
MRKGENYMKCENVNKIFKGACMALLAVFLLAGPCFALDVNLAAVEAQWTPPGGAAPVAMWGFITDPGDCTGGPYTWDIGPVIDVPNDGAGLTINLRNCLSEDVSVFIPGQIKPTAPVTFTDLEGRSRVRSFDAVVTPGSTGTYTWSAPKEGTYLYQSGTFVAKQVPKGLYGAVVVRGTAYPAAAQEEILVYSEIDPDLNNAGVGARVNNYQPRYFLINGATYPNIPDINVALNEDVLLRFVNAGLHTYVPTLQGLYMQVITEDGNLLPDAVDQYQIELTAAKTMDAIVNIGATEGRYALYDRSLHLTNGTVTGGGMLTFIQSLNNAPVANPDSYDAQQGEVLTVTAPGVLANDTDADNDPLTAYQTGTPPPGELTLNTDGSFSYTPAGTEGQVETFQYFANDGITNSLPATVSITITAPNMPPVANNDIATTPRNLPVTINILANDIDPDGTIDPATVNLTLGSTTTRGATVAVNPDGTVTYTGEGAGGPDYFYYTVNDNQNATSNEARVRVNRVRDAVVPAAAPAAAPSSGRVRSDRR